MSRLSRFLDIWRHYGDSDFPTVKQRRAYLRGVPQAQPYILSTIREVSDDPILLRQRLVQQHLAARRAEMEVAPIVGVTLDLSRNKPTVSEK